MKFIGLLSEDNGKNVSLGRLLVWVFGSFSTYFWFARGVEEFPPTLAQAFFIALGYVLGTKGVNAYKTKTTSAVADTREVPPDVVINEQRGSKKPLTEEDK